MSFEIKERGDAQSIVGAVSNADPATNARQARLATIVSQAARDISAELGGYVVVSAKGTVRERADEHYGGDNVILQVTTTLPPHPPVQDTGLQAAGGSPQNFPPESSTGAPQTADGSPNADQQPQPQPVAPGQAPLEQSVTTLGDSADVPVTPEENEEFAAHLAEAAATSTPPVIPEPPDPTALPAASTGDAGLTDTSTEQSASVTESVSDVSTPSESTWSNVAITTAVPASAPPSDTSSVGVPAAETTSEPISPVSEQSSAGTTEPSPGTEQV